MARGSSSNSILCSRERWCTYYTGHSGPCITEPPTRDCACTAPQVSSTWLGSECRACGRRVKVIDASTI